MKLDITVIAYRSPADVARFVDSISTQRSRDGWELDVLVVDVDPADHATVDALDRVGPGTQIGWGYAKTQSNIGYNAAANGYGHRGGDVQIVCNADVAFTAESPACIEALAVAALVPEWGTVGPRQVNQQRKVTAGGIFGPTDRPKLREFKRHNSHAVWDVRSDATYVAGSIVALRSDVWAELTACPVYQDAANHPAGPWLPTKHWWGDSWLGYHALHHGYCNAYLGDVWAFHDVHGAPGSLTWGQRNKAPDAALFAAACEAHGISHDQRQTI